ncbi:MAG: c-type cytochrome [Planctomycetes bacterium]|nr:c-type cytochrome [Planctomycetota bacterium]
MPDKTLSRQLTHTAVTALLLIALTPPSNLLARNALAERPESPALPPATEEEIVPGLTVTFENASGKDVRDARLAAIYVPAGASPTPFLEPGPFTAIWEGFVNADIGTDCTFSARGRGRLTITVNDEVALEAEGDDFSAAVGEEMFLRKGRNRFVVRYESPRAGDAFVRVFWVSPDWSIEPVHPTRVSHDANAPSLRAARRLREGRELMALRRCLRCHEHERSGMPELEMDAPDLSDAGARLHTQWMARWLLDPRALRSAATMPRLPDLTTQDAADIAAFLARRRKPGAQRVEASGDRAEAGKKLFVALRCIGCHTRPDGPPAPDRMPLDLIAAKWRPEALRAFLQHPDRHYAWIEMPDFGLNAEQAAELAAFLLAHSKKELPGASLPAGDGDRGQARLETAGCLSCHTLEGLTDRSRAPALARIPVAGWQRGCMAESPMNTPDFALNESERQAILAFAATDLSSLARADPVEFMTRQVKALRCIACHRRDDQYDLWTDLRGEIEANVNPQDAVLAPLAPPAEPFIPSLTWVGEKLKPEWLAAFLGGEIEERPRPYLGLLRMPVFASRAALLARGMAFEHGSSPTSPEEPAPDPALAEIGRQLAGPRGGLDCIACHGIGPRGPTKVFDAPAPNFKLARARLRREYFVRWIEAPGQVEPGTRMPQFFPTGQSALTEILDGDARRQIEALWNYVLEGEGIRPPD